MASANITIFKTVEDKDVVITRTFDASVDLVYKAYTDSKLIPQWWGPRELTTKVDKNEVKNGGAWRFLNYDAKGNEFGFHGKYLEVKKDEFLSSSFEFEGMPGHVSIQSVQFNDQGEKTSIRVRVQFESQEDRDGMISTGMERGMRESYERLDELLETLEEKV